MLVMVLERVPGSMRGELTRWLLELQAGVFVGDVSALVRDKLWEMVCSKMDGGGGLLAYSTNNEQGFALRLWGPTTKVIEDFEGLTLVRTPRSRRPRNT
jgi:CRISPR-associated protein Cas2